MQIIRLNEQNHQEIIELAAKTLTKGGLVVFPTETVYGIGALATDQHAVDTLFAYKAKRDGKPLSVAVDSIEMAKQYVIVNEVALNLYENFLPGPITVISQGLGKVAKGVESEKGTLGIRIPDYDLVRHTITALGKPITATSANASYKKKPYNINDILENLSEKQKNLISLIIDAGELPKREPSTVVDTTQGEHLVLRQGDLKLTKIRETKTHTPEETQKFAQELLQPYKQYLGYKSIIFALEGEMGAGKTEFTKGLAKTLGINTPIQSPTFIIEKEYPIATVAESYAATKKPMLYHIDTWRIADVAGEFEALDLASRLSSGHVFSIEWANKAINFFNQIKEDVIIIWVHIEQSGENTRRIIVSDFNPNQS